MTQSRRRSTGSRTESVSNSEEVCNQTDSPNSQQPSSSQPELASPGAEDNQNLDTLAHQPESQQRISSLRGWFESLRPGWRRLRESEGETCMTSRTTTDSTTPPHLPRRRFSLQFVVPRFQTPPATRDFFVACRRGWESKARERNHMAAMLSLMSVVLIGASLTDQEWFSMTGGACPLHYLGVSFFYRLGVFRRIHTPDAVYKDKQLTMEYHDHIMFKTGKRKYRDCVTPEMADLFHGVMGVCFVAASTALFAFFMDILGFSKGFLRWLQRNAVFSIFTVILCVLVVSLSYMLSSQIEELQVATASDPNRVRVEYAQGFYMIVAAAVFSLAAVGSSLFRLTQEAQREDDRLNLTDNISESDDPFDTSIGSNYSLGGRRRGDIPPGSTGPLPPLDMILNTPPPPPYTPTA